MTKEETLKIMSIIETAYPRYYAQNSQSQRKEALELWATMFYDKELPVVMGAVKAVIATNKFPPSIAEINEKIQELCTPPQMSESRAWSFVRKAISNSTYNSAAEFEKLPEECRQIVCAPEQLRAWAMMNEDEVNTVVASNFQRSYRSRAAKLKEYDMLPQNIRELIATASDNMRLIG